MKLDIISDTHLLTTLSDLPGGDILIHAGDALNSGILMDLIDFKSHLMGIADRYKHILFTPGNHDCVFEEDPSLAKQCIEEVPGLILLHERSVEIDGIKFYGTAFQPFFFDWAFNVGKKMGVLNWTDIEKLTEHYSRIPDDTEVLITHCPPYGIRDSIGDPEKSGRRTGSPELLDRIANLKKLKLHAFGHIHWSHGMEERNGIKFVNAAMCDEDYNPINPVITVEI